MIIVSQGKQSLVNTKNISCIGISDNNKREILCMLSEDTGHTLGEYKSNERAKEVLQAIVAAYQANELYKVSDRIIQETMIDEYEKKKLEPFKYEMPAE